MTQPQPMIVPSWSEGNDLQSTRSIAESTQSWRHDAPGHPSHCPGRSIGCVDTDRADYLEHGSRSSAPPATEERLAMAAELRKFAEQVLPQSNRCAKRTKSSRNCRRENETRLDQDGGTEEGWRGNCATGQRSCPNKRAKKAVEYLKQPQDSVSLAELERAARYCLASKTSLVKIFWQ